MSKITDFSKTIVALSTALGTGSIAIVRIGGIDAISIVNDVFPGKDLLAAGGNTIHFGNIKNGDTEIDQVIVGLFRSPHSYTGEDIIEISCHANPLIVQELIEVLVSRGAHHAGPGEFTLRAFLNGKIDLAQAEAISDLITVKTKRGLKNSIDQLEGSLTGYLSDIKKKLIEILGLIEIDLDFSGEDLEVVSEQEITKEVIIIQKKIARLISSYNYGKLFNSAINMVIAGQPNVGKSTLMNYLIGENRAITSHHPGTTRDTIHENVVIGHMFFKLIDTAGLRSTNDVIENEGVERSRQQIANADIVLFVLDASSHNSDNYKISGLMGSEYTRKIILVANKKDLGVSEKTRALLNSADAPVVYISASTGEGINLLKKEILRTMSSFWNQSDDEIVISAARHKEILERTQMFLTNAVSTIKKSSGFEFVSVDMREALNALGEITGETATDDILNSIFKNFCIGK